MTLGGDSQVYLAYYWVGARALRAMYCPNVDADYDKCFAFTVEDPGTVKVGKYTSIALNEKTNKFYISYYDETNGNLRVAACNLQFQCNVFLGDDGSSSTQNDLGLYTSSGIDSTGLLSVTYLDDTTNTLKYMRRNFAQPYIGQPGTTDMAQASSGFGGAVDLTTGAGGLIWTTSTTGGQVNSTLVSSASTSGSV